MTIEERAKEAVKASKKAVGAFGPKSFKEWGERLEQIIAQALRDQIEECAKIPDKYENSAMAEEIRALAAPTEEGKEIER